MLCINVLLEPVGNVCFFLFHHKLAFCTAGCHNAATKNKIKAQYLVIY